MDSLDYWRLCDEVSVVQAALLIVGEDPSESQDDIDNWEARNRPKGYDAAKTALANAIKAKRLQANIVEYDDVSEISPHRTTIAVSDLKAWLKSRGLETGFFFPEPTGPDYLSADGSHYSPKLAAAIEAWRAVSTNEELRRGKTVKQAVVVWLRQHANEFGLTKDDGNPNEQGIEDVAKIANWDTKGGAPKTPGNG
jgi:hypothetical protein